jgi:DNA-directed RNA polymerase subunit beta'
MVVNFKDNLNNFDSISVAIASPEQITAWSHGEVKKPETINYRTQKPERDGLFCERIFGPTKNYECYCGKYKRVRYKGVICEKCGVEVTKNTVRRERMGHIKLAVPVTHIWYLRSTPSRIGMLLNLPVKTIEQVVYFAAYIVIDVDHESKAETEKQLDTEYKAFRQKIKEDYEQELAALKEAGGGKAQETQLESEVAQKLENLEQQNTKAKEDLANLDKGVVLSEVEYREMSMRFGHIFKAGTGAEALHELIANMDLEKLAGQLKLEVDTASGQKLVKSTKRLKLIQSLLQAEIKPEWMILSTLPVIPPDLRPMVQLDGGRFAASDLNDLYRRVINRNNRLKKLLSIGAPEVICRNEKRMLQEAVDTLLNISARQSKGSYNSSDKRKLKSISDMLKGKQGRFRQNLLGKRVDYSGRSVIVVGPKLKLNECGLPKTMALTLFKPFVLGRLIRDGHAHNIKSAEKLIAANKKEVWDILEEVTHDKFVLLNRAPTLHRLGIQAFKPKLIEGKAIQVHPLVCPAFNADFDGDQMAVHLPLSKAAQKEAKELIQSAKNLLKPSAGEPIVTPHQDIILGCYYLTKMTEGKPGQGLIFGTEQEAIAALDLDRVHIQAPIKYRHAGELIETTVGRIILNQIVPPALQFINETLDKKKLNKLISKCFNTYGIDTTAEFADRLKDLGFHYVTQSGLSIGAEDLIIPEVKKELLKEATEKVKTIYNHYWTGLITDQERYTNTIKVWSSVKNHITDEMIKLYDPENHIHYLTESGARGKWGQVTQMAGMKGLVASPSGATIELPIQSNLKEGFTILEYFIATHGGRKGKADTALKTAEAGYLTRRLVDAVQDMIIRESDCGTQHSHMITRAESDKMQTNFEHRIFGRVIAQSVVSPDTGEILVEAGETIGNKELQIIQDHKADLVDVRSPLTCKTENGVCQQCYGYDFGNNKPVQMGTAVGIIAAQSIGEPGTQLTMNTFHMGGVAQESGDMTQGLTRIEEIFEARPPKSPALLAQFDGSVKVSTKGQNTEIHLTSTTPVETSYELPDSYIPSVKVGDTVKEKGIISKSTQKSRSIRSQENGVVTYVDNFKIKIESEDNVTKVYTVAKNKNLKVQNGDTVIQGQALTSGSCNLKELDQVAGQYAVLKYIIEEVQSIYSSQGQSINDKHVEIIARQMLSKTKISHAGDSHLIAGQTVDKIQVENLNQKLAAEGKQTVQTEDILLGLTRISLHTDSWLSAASFQETIKVLVEAATTKKIDKLTGLKENVIIGKLIPAGEIYRENKKLEN